MDFLLTEKKADPLLKSRPKSKSDAEKATSPGTSPTLTTAPSNLYDDAPSGGAAPSSGAAAGPAGAPGTPDKQERAALVAAQSRSPLFFACTKQGNKEIVQILMDAGANAEDGMEPVCMRGDDKMLRVLLNSQISLPVIERWMKKCAKNGHGSCLRLLLGTMPRSYQVRVFGRAGGGGGSWCFNSRGRTCSRVSLCTTLCRTALPMDARGHHHTHTDGYNHAHGESLHAI